jgi:hypothetical protein
MVTENVSSPHGGAQGREAGGPDVCQRLRLDRAGDQCHCGKSRVEVLGSGASAVDVCSQVNLACAVFYVLVLLVILITNASQWILGSVC